MLKMLLGKDMDRSYVRSGFSVSFCFRFAAYAMDLTLWQARIGTGHEYFYYAINVRSSFGEREKGRNVLTEKGRHGIQALVWS